MVPNKCDDNKHVYLVNNTIDQNVKEGKAILENIEEKLKKTNTENQNKVFSETTQINDSVITSTIKRNFVETKETPEKLLPLYNKPAKKMERMFLLKVQEQKKSREIENNDDVQVFKQQYVNEYVKSPELPYIRETYTSETKLTNTQDNKTSEMNRINYNSDKNIRNESTALLLKNYNNKKLINKIEKIENYLPEDGAKEHLIKEQGIRKINEIGYSKKECTKQKCTSLSQYEKIPNTETLDFIDPDITKYVDSLKISIKEKKRNSQTHDEKLELNINRTKKQDETNQTIRRKRKRSTNNINNEQRKNPELINPQYEKMKQPNNLNSNSNPESYEKQVKPSLTDLLCDYEEKNKYDVKILFSKKFQNSSINFNMFPEITEDNTPTLSKIQKILNPKKPIHAEDLMIRLEGDVIHNWFTDSELEELIIPISDVHYHKDTRQWYCTYRGYNITSYQNFVISKLSSFPSLDKIYENVFSFLAMRQVNLEYRFNEVKKNISYFTRVEEEEHFFLRAVQMHMYQINVQRDTNQNIFSDDIIKYIEKWNDIQNSPLESELVNLEISNIRKTLQENQTIDSDNDKEKNNHISFETIKEVMEEWTLLAKLEQIMYHFFGIQSNSFLEKTYNYLNQGTITYSMEMHAWLVCVWDPVDNTQIAFVKEFPIKRTGFLYALVLCIEYRSIYAEFMMKKDNLESILKLAMDLHVHYVFQKIDGLTYIPVVPLRDLVHLRSASFDIQEKKINEQKLNTTSLPRLENEDICKTDVNENTIIEFFNQKSMKTVHGKEKSKCTDSTRTDSSGSSSSSSSNSNSNSSNSLLKEPFLLKEEQWNDPSKKTSSLEIVGTNQSNILKTQNENTKDQEQDFLEMSVPRKKARGDKFSLVNNTLKYQFCNEIRNSLEIFNFLMDKLQKGTEEKQAKLQLYAMVNAELGIPKKNIKQKEKEIAHMERMTMFTQDTNVDVLRRKYIILSMLKLFMELIPSHVISSSLLRNYYYERMAYHYCEVIRFKEVEKLNEYLCIFQKMIHTVIHENNETIHPDELCSILHSLFFNGL